MQSIQGKVVFWICLINGVSALIFGGIMMLFPVNTPLGLNEMIPALGGFPFHDVFFQNLFWPGLALFLCNGVCNLIAAIAFLRKHPSAVKWALAAGVLLNIWCIVELIYLPNGAAIFYWLVGVVQLILAWFLVRKQASN